MKQLSVMKTRKEQAAKLNMTELVVKLEDMIA